MATILVDTGSRMDEVIFQEFKGTGNLELVLSRECAERRLFPAINIRESGTRKEHKILSPEVLKESHNLRRKVAEMKAPEALEVVIGALR
jgi:transcription termination factor Rho